MNYKSLFLLFSIIFPLGCSPEISERLNEQITNNKTDFTIITPRKALFIFKIDPQQSWQWYTNSEPSNQLEFGWWANFSLNGNKYSCGFSLYRYPGSKKSTGSLKQLLQSGQTDFSAREQVSETNLNDDLVVVEESIHQKKNPAVKSIAKPKSVVIILEEQEIIDEFRKLRPDSISFLRIEQPSKDIKQYNVAVSYNSN